MEYTKEALVLDSKTVTGLQGVTDSFGRWIPSLSNQVLKGGGTCEQCVHQANNHNGWYKRKVAHERTLGQCDLKQGNGA